MRDLPDPVGPQTTLIFLLAVSSVLWLGAGCLSPLTPSEGVPTYSAIALFYLAPMVVNLIILFLAPRPSEKLFVLVTFVFILLFGARVLSVSFQAA